MQAGPAAIYELQMHCSTLTSSRIPLLPSALARGSESRIYSHKVRMYVRKYVRTWWVTLRNVTRNVVTYHRQGLGIGHNMCVTQTDTFRYARNQIERRRWRWRSGTTAQRGHRGLDTTNTKQLVSYSKRSTCHARLT